MIVCCFTTMVITGFNVMSVSWLSPLAISMEVVCVKVHLFNILSLVYVSVFPDSIGEFIEMERFL